MKSPLGHFDAAYHWLRRHFPAQVDVWHLRHRWPGERARLQDELRSHGQLRRALRTLNRTFEELKLAQARDKTFIACIERGFDLSASTRRPPSIAGWSSLPPSASAMPARVG